MEQDKQNRQNDVMMGQEENVPYDMTVAGEPEETLWENMVNALKPDLTPKKKG